MDQILLRTAVTISLIALVAVVLGLIFGAISGWAAFAVSILLLLLHHVRHTDLLIAWLKQPAPGQVPDGRGVWDYVFSLLHRYQRTQSSQYQQVARTLARFRQAGRAHPDGVVILDADNRIEWCNDTAERHLDVNVRTDTGQPITNLVRQPEFIAYIESGDFERPVTLRAPHGAGEILWVQSIPYGEAQKLLLSRDVTRIEKLETMRRDFVANVSHELRTPLTVLTGFLETIKELQLDPQRTRDYLNLMAEQSKRMQSIVDDLLTLSTLESAPSPSFDERIGIAALLDKLRADAEALSGGKHRIVLEAVPGFDLLGSEREIASAFGNLVSNAIRYTPAGGEVRISWQSTPGHVEFAVQDSGIGIASEHIPRLTERFYRVDRGRSREAGGTGLGLAIVKHILNRHDATLEISSEPGKGSRFAARFSGRRVVAAAPAAASAALDADRSDSASNTAAGGEVP